MDMVASAVLQNLPKYFSCLNIEYVPDDIDPLRVCLLLSSASMWKAPECDYPDYDFHTRLARESYCNSGMERHYAGAHPDYDFHGMTTSTG